MKAAGKGVRGEEARSFLHFYGLSPADESVLLLCFHSNQKLVCNCSESPVIPPGNRLKFTNEKIKSHIVKRLLDECLADGISEAGS